MHTCTYTHTQHTEQTYTGTYTKAAVRKHTRTTAAPHSIRTQAHTRRPLHMYTLHPLKPPPPSPLSSIHLTLTLPHVWSYTAKLNAFFIYSAARFFSKLHQTKVKNIIEEPNDKVNLLRTDLKSLTAHQLLGLMNPNYKRLLLGL